MMTSNVKHTVVQKNWAPAFMRRLTAALEQHNAEEGHPVCSMPQVVQFDNGSCHAMFSYDNQLCIARGNWANGLIVRQVYAPNWKKWSFSTWRKFKRHLAEEGLL